MNSQAIANAIMDIEQKNYPYYLISEVEITGYTEKVIKYRVTICSKLDPKSKYKLVSSQKTIELSKLLEDYRDNLIEIILE
jgi:hypothetical protein